MTLEILSGNYYRLFFTFSRVTGYQINSHTQKIALLYTNENWSEKENNIFKVGSQNIKYLGVALTKSMKDFYGKNFKTL